MAIIGNFGNHREYTSLYVAHSDGIACRPCIYIYILALVVLYMHVLYMYAYDYQINFWPEIGFYMTLSIPHVRSTHTSTVPDLQVLM